MNQELSEHWIKQKIYIDQQPAFAGYKITCIIILNPTFLVQTNSNMPSSLSTYQKMITSFSYTQWIYSKRSKHESKKTSTFL